LVLLRAAQQFGAQFLYLVLSIPPDPGRGNTRGSAAGTGGFALA